MEEELGIDLDGDGIIGSVGGKSPNGKKKGSPGGKKSATIKAKEGSGGEGKDKKASDKTKPVAFRQSTLEHQGTISMSPDDIEQLKHEIDDNTQLDPGEQK